MYTLHKLLEGFVVVSDEQPLRDYKGLMLNTVVNRIFTDMGVSLMADFKKVILQQHQLDFSALPEEQQREIGWFDSHELFVNTFPNKHLLESHDYHNLKDGFTEGFKKAQEFLSDRRFTLEQVREALEMTKEIIVYPTCADRDSERKYSDEEIIQSLSKQSWTVELEMEYFDNTPPCTGQPDYDWCNTPKGMVGFRPKFVEEKVKILKLL